MMDLVNQIIMERKLSYHHNVVPGHTKVLSPGIFGAEMSKGFDVFEALKIFIIEVLMYSEDSEWPQSESHSCSKDRFWLSEQPAPLPCAR